MEIIHITSNEFKTLKAISALSQFYPNESMLLGYFASKRESFDIDAAVSVLYAQGLIRLVDGLHCNEKALFLTTKGESYIFTTRSDLRKRIFKAVCMVAGALGALAGVFSVLRQFGVI